MVEEEQDEKRIIESSCGGGGVSTTVVVEVPPELVVAEVLTRLPAKSLMRFKCVSTLWSSTISNDTSFYKAHRRASSGLFVTYPDSDDYLRCFYTTLPSIGESVLLHQFRISTVRSCSDSDSCKFNGATEVINGLFCLFAGNRSWICNVSTREIKELPPSSGLDNAICFHYFFGFVSSTCEEYKLLKFCLLPRPGNITVFHTFKCEILTLGKDSLWRRPWPLLDSPEFDFVLNRNSVYIDGYLCCWQVIDPPPKASGRSSYDERGSLPLQFRGNFALLREDVFGRVLHGLGNRKLELWVLELEKHKQGSYKWINHSIDVPCDFPTRAYSFLGNLRLPTGDQTLLTGQVEMMNKSDVPVYSYDHTKGKFDSFIIGKVPPWSPPMCLLPSVCRKDTNKFRICYYEEDITPLSRFIVCNKDSSLNADSCSQKKKKKKKKGSRTTIFQRTSVANKVLLAIWRITNDVQCVFLLPSLLQLPFMKLDISCSILFSCDIVCCEIWLY